VHNSYNETVVNRTTVNTRTSYNGGSGGIAAAPTPQERAAAKEQHVAPTPMQRQHVQEAAKMPSSFAKSNGGHPPIAATPRPGAFHAPGVVGAKGASTAAPRPASAEQTRATPATQPPAGAPKAGAGKPNPPKPNAAKPGAPKPPPKAPPPKPKQGEGDNK
jgi:hypothetical protein